MFQTPSVPESEENCNLGLLSTSIRRNSALANASIHPRHAILLTTFSLREGTPFPYIDWHQNFSEFLADSAFQTCNIPCNSRLKLGFIQPICTPHF